MYFPAIPVISRDFHKSVELINLTVTMYMVMQGICAHFFLSHSIGVPLMVLFRY